MIPMPEKNQSLTLILEGGSHDSESEHVTRRNVTATFSYKESPDSPMIEIRHKVEHIHYRSWEDMNVPRKEGAVEALVEIANDDGAKFLTE